MAGSGKTTLMQQMNAYMGMTKKVGYLINLDPAVLKLPYEPNIDIRDTVRRCASP
jgi:GPN-loop GTPase